MRMRALASALLLPLPLAAAERKPFTADVMWTVQRVGTPVVSPDGRQVAYTVSAYDMEENRANADVWVVPVAGGVAANLTAAFDRSVGNAIASD